MGSLFSKSKKQSRVTEHDKAVLVISNFTTGLDNMLLLSNNFSLFPDLAIETTTR